MHLVRIDADFYPKLFFVPTESPGGYSPYQHRSSSKSLNSAQRQELDFDTSSEEHAGTRSPSPPQQSAGIQSSNSSPAQQHTALSSQDSKTSIMAKTNQAPGGVQQYLERSAAPTAQHPNVGPDPTPPALPPKTRKSKVLEAPKVSEHSDRGDSDMDEETYSSSQEKQKVKKVCLFFKWTHFNGFPAFIHCPRLSIRSFIKYNTQNCVF